jgi:hypothetical protein
MNSGTLPSPETLAGVQKIFIIDLMNPEEPPRKIAAKGIFLLGRVLSRDAAEPWEHDPELSHLLLRDSVQAGSGDQGPLRATVGIAVTPETFSRIRRANGMPPLAIVPPDQDAEEFEFHFFDTDSRTAMRLDILTTKKPDGDGAIAKFLAKFGEGIQQVEYEVTDVDKATRILAERFGVKGIYPATREGADGTRVNFFLVPAASGRKILIELVESAPPAR